MAVEGRGDIPRSVAKKLAEVAEKQVRAMMKNRSLWNGTPEDLEEYIRVLKRQSRAGLKRAGLHDEWDEQFEPDWEKAFTGEISHEVHGIITSSTTRQKLAGWDNTPPTTLSDLVKDLRATCPKETLEGLQEQAAAYRPNGADVGTIKAHYRTWHEQIATRWKERAMPTDAAEIAAKSDMLRAVKKWFEGAPVLSQWLAESDAQPDAEELWAKLSNLERNGVSNWNTRPAQNVNPARRARLAETFDQGAALQEAALDKKFEEAAERAAEKAAEKVAVRYHLGTANGNNFGSYPAPFSNQGQEDAHFESFLAFDQARAPAGPSKARFPRGRFGAHPREQQEFRGSRRREREFKQCVDFENGRCTQGKNCRLSHLVCNFFARGECNRSGCTFCHIRGDAGPENFSGWQAAGQGVCRDFQRGRCYRARCKFAHVEAQNFLPQNSNMQQQPTRTQPQQQQQQQQAQTSGTMFAQSASPQAGGMQPADIFNILDAFNKFAGNGWRTAPTAGPAVQTPAKENQ
jgi:hypothetical protein